MPMRLIVLICLLASAMPGQQLQDQVLISPISGKPFSVQIIPVTKGSRNVIGDPGPSDMGVDPDGCRHSSGPTDYEYYVVTDPYSYFSALASEYRQGGRRGRGTLRADLTEEFKDWLLSKDGFHTEWVTDKDKYYGQARRQAKLSGNVLPPIHDWVIPQGMLPIEKKYRLALECYQKRQATDYFQGRLALMAVWATRARLNKPILDIRLKGGIEEVNTRLVRYIEDGERFSLEKYYDAYKRLFQSGRLGEEAYFIAGITYFGFALRMGDLEESLGILAKLTERYDDESDDLHIFLRGLVRTRRQVLKLDYLGFLDLTAKHLIRAMGNEEVPRVRIPETMMVIAENLRRQGQLERAAGWYLALGQIEEGEPRLREEIRESGKMPAVGAPVSVLLAWQADEQYERLERKLRADGVTATSLTSHQDAHLLNAIIHEGLGTAAYQNPRWHPRTGSGSPLVATLVKQTGLAVLDYTERAGEWPRVLDDLWESGVVSDRNRFNRFHCPHTGKPLLYKRIGGPIESLPPRTVLLATAAPVPHDGTEAYALFLSDLQVVFSPNLVEPGQIYADR